MKKQTKTKHVKATLLLDEPMATAPSPPLMQVPQRLDFSYVGGAFDVPSDRATATYRGVLPADRVRDKTGFRTARSVK